MPDAATAANLLNEALDGGVTVLDTAPTYGRSEELIGEAVSHRRSEYALITKVEVAPDVAADRIARIVSDSVEGSLRRLRTDAVDVLLLHSVTTDVLTEGRALDALESERARGRCRWIGASTYGVAAAEAAARDSGVDCLQVAYSALDRRLESPIDDIAGRGIGIVARSVLLKGVLTARAATLPKALDPLREAAATLEEVASAAGISLPELAIRFAISNPSISTCLIGTSSTAECLDAVRWAERGPALGRSACSHRSGDGRRRGAARSLRVARPLTASAHGRRRRKGITHRWLPTPA